MKTQIRITCLEVGIFPRRLLHAIFAEMAVSGSQQRGDRLSRMGLGDRQQFDGGRIAAGGAGGVGNGAFDGFVTVDQGCQGLGSRLF
jgi:hypothetical protein